VKAIENISIRELADELGISKDYALRIVKRRAKNLGISPVRGARNQVFLSRTDADKLIADYEPRVQGANTAQSNDGYGYFYLIQLLPEELPNRYKLGYTNNIEVRLADHRTAAPTLRLVKSWRCKQTWEAAAIASITRDNCTKVGVEVYDGPGELMVERAEVFFDLMPLPAGADSAP